MNSALIFMLALICLLAGCATPPPVVRSGLLPQSRGDIVDSLSPKLRAILVQHPAAKDMLTNAFSKAFAGKHVQLFYFYCGDTNTTPGFHFYRGEGFVNIAVSEKEDPWDQYVVVLGETINSKHEKSFTKLFEEAQRGRLSRTEFPLKVLRLEHQTAMQTRGLIKELKLSEAELAGAALCRRLLNCPDDFDEFLAYVKSQENGRNPVLEYERVYDENMHR